MMNILVINGSPKGSKSNTYRLTSAFLEGVKSRQPDWEERTITASRLEIKSCLGCFSCWNKTPGVCCHKDDMPRVIENILWADTIIWSFPLYYFSVPGPLKNLIDRQLPMSLPFMTADSESGGHPSRYQMENKRHVVISTCGFYTAKGNYDGVNALFDHMCGKGKYTSIYCGQGELFRVKELSQRTGEYLSYVRTAGAEFCTGSISPDTAAKLEQLLFPRDVFEAMADASWGIEKTGEKSDETAVFTRQMAALYNKDSYSGKDLVLEMFYTDENKVYQIILGKDGSRVLTENFLPFTTRIETPYVLWKEIAEGKISGEEALMQQRYRVKGDFNLMIYWDKYFGSRTEQTVTAAAPVQKPTSMALLLLPWIIFWITTSSMDGTYAGLVSIAVSVCAPLLFMKHRMIVFDHISAAVVTLCSGALILGVPVHIVLPVSHLGFGLLWTINGFAKIPLTAYYSNNDYGGEGMLSNPLFIKTNRILTLCWGILYLLMTLWTALLMHFGADWIATVNSILPALMSVFTLWFQKWYPAKVASGDI